MTKAKALIDSSLEYIQQKIVNITGLLSVAWNDIADAKNDLSEEMTLSLEKLSTNLDIFVLLMGQAFRLATYHRRYNALFLS